jgi:hypothetical protein
LLVAGLVVVVSLGHAAPSADLVVAWAPAELGDLGEGIADVSARAGAAYRDESPGAVPIADPRPLIKRGITAYEGLELDGALTALDQAAAIVDQTGAAQVDTTTLGNLFLYRAMTLAPREATRSWDDLVIAAGIQPTRVLEQAGFSPSIVKRFAEAQAEVLAKPRGKLTLTGPKSCAVRIDGATLTTREVELPFGAHWLDAACPGHEPVRRRLTVDRVTMEVSLAGKKIEPPTDEALLIQARAAAARAMLVVIVRGDTAVIRKLGIDGKERDRDSVTLLGLDRDRRNVAGAVADMLAPPAVVKRDPWYKSRWLWAGVGAAVVGGILTPFIVTRTGQVPDANLELQNVQW